MKHLNTFKIKIPKINISKKNHKKKIALKNPGKEKYKINFYEDNMDTDITNITVHNFRENRKRKSKPDLARFMVLQQEHLTLVAPRVYINNVRQLPQTSWAISIPAEL